MVRMAAPMTKPPITQRYEDHRRQLLVANLLVPVSIIFGLTLFYAVAEYLFHPDAFRRSLATYIVQLAVLPVAVWLARGPARRSAPYVLLAADLVYTAAIVGQLLQPDLAVSGLTLAVS